jgi:hypothetical protein
MLHLPTDHLIQAIDDPIERCTARQLVALLDELVRRSNAADEEAIVYLEYMALEAEQGARYEA